LTSTNLAAELGYTHPSANLLQRAVKAFGSSRPGAWLFSRILRHLDDLVGRLSRGRTSAPQLLAGLAVLDVTTTGRRSGKPRTSHLISFPVGDWLALLGTNFGQETTPAWVLNLEADPHATLTYRGRSVDAVARPATDAELEQVVLDAARHYVGYAKYRERIGTSRRLRVFLLSAASPRMDAASGR
jgi:deazaflavin-dependent oxidoreductase (nitroreductase family)